MLDFIDIDQTIILQAPFKLNIFIISFLVLEISKWFCKLSENGDLEKLMKLFKSLVAARICEVKFWVKTNTIENGKSPTLVETYSRYNGNTALILAAIHGHYHVYEYLMSQMAIYMKDRELYEDHHKLLVEARDHVQRTALIWAATNDHIDFVRKLLVNNVDIRALDKHGSHAAYWAARGGYLETLKLLVEKKTELSDLKVVNGMTLLMAAAKNGRLLVCIYLVTEKKADVNSQDDEGKTALSKAFENTNFPIAEFLFKNGAKDLKDNSGRPLFLYRKDFRGKRKWVDFKPRTNSKMKQTHT